MMDHSLWPATQIEHWPIDRLVPYARNARTHTDAQIAQIAASIREWGWTIPVLVAEDGTILAGHARVLAAIKLGITQVPVIVARGWSEAKKRGYVIADNKLTLNSAWDGELLRIELADLKLEEFPLELLGFDDSELASILNLRSAGATDPDDVPPVPVKPVARPGDLWHLGRHRLLCSDATERADVEFLLAGAQPHLMVTDPPYGVNYDADWRNSAQRANGQPFGGRAVGKVTNDDCVDWRAAWRLFKGDVAYVWHGALHVANMSCQLTESGFDLRALIVWAKNNFAVSRGHYHWQHETLWYAVRKGQTAHWSGDRSQTTLWNIDKPLKSETGHSTQKPVECMMRPIENNSKAGDVVYAPFEGSGTTIIAAEMTGRRCYAIEIAPAYCDTAILRWQYFTGEKATLDGRTFDEVRGARCDPNCDMAEGVAIASETVPPREGCMADERTSL
jgi:DNA modification methylase